LGREEGRAARKGKKKKGEGRRNVAVEGLGKGFTFSFGKEKKNRRWRGGRRFWEGKKSAVRKGVRDTS